MTTSFTLSQQQQDALNCLPESTRVIAAANGCPVVRGFDGSLSRVTRDGWLVSLEPALVEDLQHRAIDRVCPLLASAA